MRLPVLAVSAFLAMLSSGAPSYSQEAEAAAGKVQDIPANASTKATLELGRTVYSSLETVGDHDWFRVELKTGVEYQVRVHGVGVKELNDPLLELRDASGNSIGSVDDMAPGTSWGGSNASDPVGYINIAASGTFYLDISSFVDGSTADDVGDYIVTLVENPKDDGFFQTHDEIAWQITTNHREFFGYDSAIAFQLDQKRTLTYDVSKLTEPGKRLAEAALQSWSDVTGITFKKTSKPGAHLDFDDSDPGVNAYTNSSVGGSTITSSKIMVTTGWLNNFGADLSSYSFETYLNQIGMALGLGYAGNYNGSVNDQYYKNDSVAYSVMSFSQAANDEFTQGQPANNPNVDASFRYMMTMGVADIIAIQNLYGAATDTRTGDTTYGFNSNTGDKALDGAAKLGADMFMCVYDNGGIDTLDLGRAKVAQRIDLRTNSLSSVLGGKLNLCVGRGTIIENVIGGSGKDTIIGNIAANSLTGGDGKDTFVFATKFGTVDRLEDFVGKDDIIELSTEFFSKLSKGDLDKDAFKDIGEKGAKVDPSDRIIYDRGTGALAYDPDGKGGDPAIPFAKVVTKARLTAANFKVVEGEPTTPSDASGQPDVALSGKGPRPALSDRPASARP